MPTMAALVSAALIHVFFGILDAHGKLQMGDSGESGVV
jgi:hypothetical protein